ncbi:MAG: tetratricopeptide repeat protein, partial [Gemmatimonadales bacterium]
TMESFAHALSAAVGDRPTPLPVPVVAPPSRSRRVRPALVAMGLVALLAGGLLTARLASRRAPAAAVSSAEAADRVLVVLPFKNLGAPTDQYFADGLTEEITSRLASLSGLRVISRTSAEQYRTTNKALKEIGAELGAGFVLEGSVRWERADSGPGRVRVTPQLIQAADDSHLWADSYEAELTEVFRIQSDIAERVTAALDLALQAPERAALASAGTRSPEAFDFYLRGNEYAGRSYSRSNIEAAVDLYRKAVALDSAFALAQARLARAHSAMYWFYYDRTPARLASAKAAVDAALQLAPELPEARTALGYYYYWGLRDYDLALTEFERALQQQPSNSELLAAIAYVERRRGRWDQATARMSEALRYDPRSALRTLDLADTYMSVRKYPEAERLFDRAIQLAPDWAEPYAYRAMLHLVWRGDLTQARAVVGQALTRVNPGRLAQALLIPDAISAALLTADSLFAASVDAVAPSAFDGDTARYHLFAAEAAHYRKHAAAMRAHGDSARVLLERQVRAQPDDAKLLVRLGLANARAGRKGEAITAGRRAAALLPPSKDANSGPTVLTHLAEIYTIVGEPDLAIETLRPLLAIPSWITVSELQSDPTWAPLRTHPRFAALAPRS